MFQQATPRFSAQLASGREWDMQIRQSSVKRNTTIMIEFIFIWSILSCFLFVCLFLPGVCRRCVAVWCGNPYSEWNASPHALALAASDYFGLSIVLQMSDVFRVWSRFRTETVKWWEENESQHAQKNTSQQNVLFAVNFYCTHLPPHWIHFRQRAAQVCSKGLKICDVIQFFFPKIVPYFTS